MAVSALTAARRSRPSLSRVLLVCLYATAAVTGLVLGGWPQRLIAVVLLAAAGRRTALLRNPVRTPPAHRLDHRPPQWRGSRP
ncbi:hypothetical protein AB0P32_10480 [Streptomyces sp. NPDC085995]|uniref:hypothetical protein n=1 Tax=Streptomyces sp. NPDC085995 TaxID=3154861 RepID=UPI00341D3111